MTLSAVSLIVCFCSILSSTDQRIRRKIAGTDWTEGLNRNVRVHREGDILYFECNTANKEVVGRIRWQKYSKGAWRKVAPDEHIEFSPTSTYLVLMNTTVDNSGRYRCTDRQKVIYTALVLKIGRPEPPREFTVKCYIFICTLKWKVPLYPGHGHSPHVNYIVQYKLKNEAPVRRSISTTSTFIHLRKGLQRFYIRVWSNSTAGRSVYPSVYKVVIPPNHPINSIGVSHDLPVNDLAADDAEALKTKLMGKAQDTPTTLLETKSPPVPTAMIVIGLAAVVCCVPLLLTATLVIKTACVKKHRRTQY